MNNTSSHKSWSREELESAYQHWYTTINQAAAGEISWQEFTSLYTDDVVYHDQIAGELKGREGVWEWASMALASFPGDQFIAFPEVWHAIDETQGLIIARLQNQMADPGDGVQPAEPHISVLTYAGKGLFSAQTDSYDVDSFLDMIKTWGRHAMELGTLDEEQRAWFAMVYPETVPAGITISQGPNP